MAVLNAKVREIEAKLVYYGTALGGKTTNLLVLHRLAEADQKQKLVSLNTAGDRTLFFDLLPFDLGKILDWRIRLKLYSIPGQPEYNETRRIVLAGTDGIVFVADSDPAREPENVRSVNFLKLNLQQNRIDPATVPLVFQYNKRDLPDATPSAVLEGDLNWRRVPYHLAVAVAGDGVLETFEAAVAAVAESLLERLGSRSRANASADEIRTAVHDKLQPLYARRSQWSEGQRLAPAESARHVVMVAHGAVAPAAAAAPAAGAAPAPAKPLDTQDLLERAILNEMDLLNEMLARDVGPAVEVAKAPPDAAMLDPAKLGHALAQASVSAALDANAAPFLKLACEVAGTAMGSVLLLTPGEGRLAEAAVTGLAHEPLNDPGPFATAPVARRLAALPRALFDAAAARTACGSAIARADLPVPVALVPLTALGRRLGLLVLHARPGAPPIAERHAVVEAVAAVLALVLAVRGLERRLASLSAPSGVPDAVGAR